MPNFQRDTDGMLKTNLEAYYKLEDVTDFFNDNDLTNGNSVAFNAGKVNSAANTGSNNTNKNLQILSDLGIQGGNISINLWINLTTVPSAEKIIAIQGDDGTHVQYQLSYTGTTWRAVRDKTNVSAAEVIETHTPNADTWYNLALTYNGSNMELWRNGISKGSVASSGNGVSGASEAFTLFSTHGGSQLVSGLIDECGVWSKKLSNTEIEDLYNDGSGQTMQGDFVPKLMTIF